MTHKHPASPHGQSQRAGDFDTLETGDKFPQHITLDAFHARCLEHARHWRDAPTPLPDAVDRLHDWALARGLVLELGEDIIQATMAQAFAAVRGAS